MPLHKLSQKSFVNGQYDRTAQNQESVSGGGVVASGLSYAKNVLSSDKGELRKRLGTKFLKELSGASVIIPFRTPDENDVILVCDSDKIHGYNYTNDGLTDLLSVTSSSSVPFPEKNTWNDGTAAANNITNGDWGITFSWAYAQQYPGWIINGGGYVNGYGEKYYDGYGIATTTQTPQSIMIYNSNTAACLREIRFWFYKQSINNYEYGAWLSPVIQYSDDGVTWTGVQTNQQISDTAPFRYFPAHQAGGITIKQRYIGRCAVIVSQTNYSGNHRYWRVYFQSYQSAPDAVQIGSVEFVNVGVVQVFDKPSPYTTDQLKNIKYSQENNELYIACEDVIPYKLLNNTGEFIFGSFTPVNTPTIWSTIGGYPSAVVVFQNRLWFGGFENNPQTVIASKFNDYNTFNVSSPLQKDDMLNLRCNQLKTKIKNLVGGQTVLYCFSEDGISNIDGGSTGMLATNENIEFILKNRMPAGSSTPGFKDDVMLYSSSDGTKLYGVDFDLLVNRFQVSDLAKYAKDITKEKVTELHYVNNESKLVYGLTESGKMFALLYEKGQYQGFFPMDFNGTVYDIAPIKVGRDYKLLMVVFRDGNWYLEEKLDAGNYIDTSTPRLTGEEKKWATYDNLENNIALDCYQTYDESFDAETQITDETHIVSNVDLSDYVGKTIMLSNDNSKDFVVATVKSVQVLYAWNASYSLDGSIVCYTDNAQPVAGDLLYDKYGAVLEEWDLPGNYVPADVYPGHITVLAPPRFGTRQAVTGYENPSSNICVVSIEIETVRGTSTSYTKIYPAFTEFTPNLPRTADIGVISEGRYFNATQPDINGKIYLPAPAHRVIYGVNYEALAILKIQTPYESMKQVAQVDVSVIDTTHLEIGTDFSDTQNIEKIDDSSYYDLTRITMNDTYRIVVSDTPEMTKNVILRSNKGVPFTVNAVDVYVNYSNLGGD